MNQIVNIIMRVLMRKVISRGIDKGFDMASGRKKGNQNSGHGVSDEDRAEMEAMKNKQRQTKQAMKVTRRMGKF